MSRRTHRVVSYVYVQARTPAEARRLARGMPPAVTLVEVRKGDDWLDVTHQVRGAEEPSADEVLVAMMRQVIAHVAPADWLEGLYAEAERLARETDRTLGEAYESVYDDVCSGAWRHRDGEL